MSNFGLRFQSRGGIFENLRLISSGPWCRDGLGSAGAALGADCPDAARRSRRCGGPAVARPPSTRASAGVACADSAFPVSGGSPLPRTCGRRASQLTMQSRGRPALSALTALRPRCDQAASASGSVQLLQPLPPPPRAFFRPQPLGSKVPTGLGSWIKHP